MQQFYTDKRTQGTGVRTLVFCHQRLSQALKMAVRLGMVARNVCDAVTAPRYERVPKETWTPKELGRFLHAAEESTYGPIWLMLALTGMRRGEVLGLRWQDIDFEGGFMTIIQTSVAVNGAMHTSAPKTRAGRRVITLEPVLARALHEHRVQQKERRLLLGTVWQDHDLVFASEVGTPILARNLYRQYALLVEKAGVPHISIHGIRHTVATLAISSGQDIRTVADLLGHARTSITTDIYAHVMPHRKRELTKAISELVLSSQEAIESEAKMARKTQD